MRINSADNITNSKVTNVIEYTIFKAQAAGGSNNGYATNYYTGSSTINGIRLSTTAPTVQTTEDKAMSFLSNAVARYTSPSKACNAAYYGSNYFAQIGFTWYTYVNYVIWADTSSNCAGMATGISYSAGKLYDFRIYVTNGKWHIYAKNIHTNEVFSKTRSGITYGVFENNNYNTSIFLETHTFNPAGDQFITYPSGTSKVSINGGSSWFNWQNGARTDLYCGTAYDYPYNSSKEVISGNVANGGSATWNTIRMAQYYPSC